MIHYHGTPITPSSAAIAILRGRHAMVSFANQQQVTLAFEICQSVVLDCGAYSLWGRGESVDAMAYMDFVDQWKRHPGFDWCLIPDKIDGTEEENRRSVEAWDAVMPSHISVPVWHLNESMEYLEWLCKTFPRVAFGSSGEWPNPGEPNWWDRINEAMAVAAPDGIPVCKLHGLRMLDPTIFSAIPFASADSCNVARNIGIDSRWDGHMYLRGLSKADRAQVMAARIESHAAASTWNPRTVQMNFSLLG